jgi:hypothetical protein
MLVVSFCCSSCSKENRFSCFKSNGSTITEQRTVPKFDSVYVADKIEVTISNGSEYKVEVIAGKNVIKNIVCEVKNGQLEIRNKNTCNFVRGYKHKFKVNITTPYLKRCENDGVGPVIFADNFAQDVIYLRVVNSGDVYLNGTFSKIYSSSHGNGDVHFKGKTKELHIYTNGTNYIRAEEMVVSDYVFIATLTLGDATFNLTNTKVFDYYIWNDGNVKYSGTPLVINHPVERSGKGQLIKLD